MDASTLNNAQDLHDLVSLVPTVEHPPVPSTNEPQTASSHTQLNLSQEPLTSSEASTSHSQSNLTDAPNLQRQSLRRPFLSMSPSSGTSSHRHSISSSLKTSANPLALDRSNTVAGPSVDPGRGDHVHHNRFSSAAEKEIDDVEEPFHSNRRPMLRHQNTLTSTRVNRLFAPSPASLAASREPSFQKQSHRFNNYTSRE